ncbi:MAG: cob(I)yrinic acid a,c-diamide adenosyltransferase, partial [Lachnospiraceae bacterium]|nr:cob(I)yrinic acid a,c-diamide adenosyltransferase [Lachnospiraceae bacterium]
AADDERTPEQREEEKENIRNGFHYARKVLVTGECDILILDEILGVLDNNFITVDELKNLIELRGETSVILTGRSMPDGLYGSVDDITELKTVRFKNYGTADTAAQTAAQ